MRSSNKPRKGKRGKKMTQEKTTKAALAARAYCYEGSERHRGRSDTAAGATPRQERHRGREPRGKDRDEHASVFGRIR
jgi:hypothetical protein